MKNKTYFERVINDPRTGWLFTVENYKAIHIDINFLTKLLIAIHDGRN